MTKKKVKENGKFKDAKEVLELHKHSSDLYVASNALALETEMMVMKRWGEVGTGFATGATQDIPDIGYRPHHPGKPRALMDNFRRNVTPGIGSDLERKVLPLSIGDKEDGRCTKLEWWLDGVDRLVKWQTDRDYQRDASFWYIMRGRACFEQRFNLALLNTEHLPFETIVADPLGIFPVRGRRGILWYTKEYTMYARELEEELKAIGRSTKFLEVEKNDNSKITVVEYWDDTYAATVVGDELVTNIKHNYGFVPLTEAHCMDTPMLAAEWAFSSVLGPVMDALKLQAELAEKMRTGLKLFFYPMMYYVSANGVPVIFDPYNVGKLEPMPVGTEIKIIPVNVNHQVFQQLFSYAQAEINLGTMPESTFGVEPSSLQSGFAISQVIQQSRMAIMDKIPNLERALGKHYGNTLRLAKKFGLMSGARMGVPVDYDE